MKWTRRGDGCDPPVYGKARNGEEAGKAKTKVGRSSHNRNQQASPSSRVLLDERPLVLLPSLATAVGVDGAIVLQQLHYYLGDPNCGREHDGHQWIFNTYEQWQTHDFPFWPAYRVGQIFRGLERRRLIMSCQPEGRADGVDNRRKYYRIAYEQLNKAVEASRVRVRDHCKTRRSDHCKTQQSRTKTSLTKNTSKDEHMTDASLRHAFVSKDLASPHSSLRDMPHSHTRMRSSVSNSWRDEYTPEALERIDDYNARLVPRGWRRINRYSQELVDALYVVAADMIRAEFIAMLDEAADARERDESYNTPKGNKLIRILWANY